MTGWTGISSAIPSVVALAGIGYLGLAAVFVRRLGAKPVPPASAAPAVTILKPLHGSEPGLLDNLRSFVGQDYPGPVRIVLGVQNPADPAIAVVRQLQASCPDRDIVLVVDGRSHGTNRKVSNLINMAERAAGEIVVLADSDMRVGPNYLSRIVALLEGGDGASWATPTPERSSASARPSPQGGGEALAAALEPDPRARPERLGIGAVTCLYHGEPDGTLAGRLMALGIDTHFLPGVATGIGLGIGHPCMGSTIAMRRDTLERIGGFASVADELADDHVLGQRVRNLGLAVAVTPFTIGHLCAPGSFRDLFRQELRWMRTVRGIEPAGHAGAVMSHPLLFALLALLAAPGLPTVALCAAALLARVGLAMTARRTFGLRRHGVWLIPVRDILTIVVYGASFLGRAVSWRGHAYGVSRSGALLPESVSPTTRPGSP